MDWEVRKEKYEKWHKKYMKTPFKGMILNLSEVPVYYFVHKKGYKEYQVVQVNSWSKETKNLQV